MIEFIPFHKNVQMMKVVGELEMTPEGVGCKINEFLMVMYYPCKSAEEMQSIEKNGFSMSEGKLGKGIYMYRTYKEAIEKNSDYLIFTRVTKGNYKDISVNELNSLDTKGLDRASLINGEEIIDCIYNTANIDIIAFIELAHDQEETKQLNQTE
ncbi:hypothetical protein ENUP19_0126G0057 [Entamoeba nuttalli]|uniref:Uncharacterized protein n=2 Tax=Entamoeba nuttalli TaxID=412467 RepID=K2H3Y7_ENTNP|nr:hypothetical protein ENU1_028530 [Entamoeba nuttalli P19]EKE42213.1 hypothetical protein ENU1_028530 [Entamoeba nuttalli P19]|eukprot:XP_008855451.1 hypothetical protein ENU1_028530 [Entamoeba nuttalli P19]